MKFSEQINRLRQALMRFTLTDCWWLNFVDHDVYSHVREINIAYLRLRVVWATLRTRAL